MNKINRAGRIAAVVVGLLMASTAFAEQTPVGPTGDSDGDNHYILECGAFCNRATAPGTIGPGHTGAWFDPTQSGHGLFVEVLPGNRIQAAWFTFNPAGTEQAWFVGTGTYAGNTATLTSVVQPAGGRWIPNFDPSRIADNSWGTLTLTFESCYSGTVEFTSTQGYGAGSMKLTRLTQPVGLAC